MTPFSQRNFRYNVIINMFDGGFFGFAIGFVSFTTFLPLFVSTMTDSAILIGLVPAVHNMGWLLPQLFTSKTVARLQVLKPYVLINTIHERLPFFFLAIVAWLIPTVGPSIALVLTFAMLIWQGLGAGLAANGWQNMIAKIIPSDFLATFFGLQSAVANLLASAGAIIAGTLVERNPGSRGFTYLFLIASLFMLISWFFLRQTREEPSQQKNDLITEIPLWKTIGSVFRENKPFVWFIASRMLF